MSFRGLIIRLAYVGLTTWVVGSILDAFGLALLLALALIWFYEVLRPRRQHDQHPTPPSDD